MFALYGIIAATVIFTGIFVTQEYRINKLERVEKELTTKLSSQQIENNILRDTNDKNIKTIELLNDNIKINSATVDNLKQQLNKAKQESQKRIAESKSSKNADSKVLDIFIPTISTGVPGNSGNKTNNPN